MELEKEMIWDSLNDMVWKIHEMKIDVCIDHMNEFAYKEKNKIFINKNLPKYAKIFVLAHEIGHIKLNDPEKRCYSSSEIEEADKWAIKALSEISRNEDDDFSFTKLMKYSYFHKLKEYLNDKNLI